MKRNSLYNTKSGFEIKDLDDSKREVAVYLSKFDNMDSDMDIIKKGAFKKSIGERGPMSSSNRKIAFLRHHDWQKQIGKFITLEEDDFGLFAVGRLGTSTQGEDAYRDYSEGIILEHSIGFQYIADKSRFVEDLSLPSKGFYEINELKLYEGSAVTFGSNEETNVIAVKSQEDKEAQVHKMSDQLNACIKSLSNGKGTEERQYQLEMKIKNLTSRLMLLTATEPDKKVHSIEVEPTIYQGVKWDDIVQGLTKKS